MNDYRMVDPVGDAAQVARFGDLSRIGIDTEFMRERTFHAQLCLVQISTEDGVLIADPLGNPPLNDEFWASLTGPEWVLHSARQDFEVILHTCGRLPNEVFDTQIAAALLGLQPQIGYAGLVKSLFDIELDKAHTRANWSRRPLSPALLDYAALDVAYLLPARDELAERLDRSGRLEWAIQDSRALLDRGLYEVDPTRAIDRLKGARNLRGPSRAAAAGLAEWREREALAKDRPRQWILRDAVLIDIAMTAPQNRKALAQIEGLAERTVRRAGDALLKIIDDAAGQRSDYRPPGRPDERQKATLKEMQKRVANCADDVGIAAEVIAPKKELSAAMLGERGSRLFAGWRRELIGEELLGLLDSA